MPNENGKLTDAEWEQVSEWIRSHAPQMQCPLCKNHEIVVGGSVGIPSADQGHSGTGERSALLAGSANLQEVPVNLFRERGGHYRTPDRLKLECPNCGHPVVPAGHFRI